MNKKFGLLFWRLNLGAGLGLGAFLSSSGPPPSAVCLCLASSVASQTGSFWEKPSRSPSRSSSACPLLSQGAAGAGPGTLPATPAPSGPLGGSQGPREHRVTAWPVPWPRGGQHLSCPEHPWAPVRGAVTVEGQVEHSTVTKHGPLERPEARWQMLGTGLPWQQQV